MIIRSDELIVTNIIGIKRTNNIDGERHYGINLHIHGGGSIGVKTGSNEQNKKLIDKLGDILIEEQIHRARTDDSKFEYIVNIENDKIVSKQLITSDKVEKITSY